MKISEQKKQTNLMQKQVGNCKTANKAAYTVRVGREKPPGKVIMYILSNIRRIMGNENKGGLSV